MVRGSSMIDTPGTTPKRSHMTSEESEDFQKHIIPIE
jgi:hypothetical protein